MFGQLKLLINSGNAFDLFDAPIVKINTADTPRHHISSIVGEWCCQNYEDVVKAVKKSIVASKPYLKLDY